jgi:hypothetical protein
VLRPCGFGKKIKERPNGENCCVVFERRHQGQEKLLITEARKHFTGKYLI